MYNDYGGGTNFVNSCPNCSLASAHAVRWDAWATPLWRNYPHPQIHPHGDHNRVNGTIGAGPNHVRS